MPLSKCDIFSKGKISKERLVKKALIKVLALKVCIQGNWNKRGERLKNDET